MDNINIQEAKKVLENLLAKNETENFKLVLRLLYRNEKLQKQSADWIKTIENKKKLSKNITENDDFNIFYYAHPTHSNKNYKYYINKLGIVMLVKTNDTNDLDYRTQLNKNNSWFLPIDENGCIDGDSFNKDYKGVFPMEIGNLSIYNLMQESKWLEMKANYVTHHIVCNFDKENKNDARDNRLYNIINIPEELHVHAELETDEEKEQAKQIYEQIIKECRSDLLIRQ